MANYILAIDQGTTSSRAILFDRNAKMVGKAMREVHCSFPHRGWVEVDPLEIYISVVDVTNEVLIKSNVTFDDIAAIGITNQRETTVVWDKKSGKPIYPGIVWQSRQSSKICEDLEKYEDLIHKKTGLLINPYFSASKIRFILDKVSGAQKRAEDGELYFGTIDSWLIYKLSNGKVHATDATNASRTLLYNIFESKWDDELLKIFNIPKSMLPEVKPSSCDFGAAEYFNKNVHIMGVAGDQQASLFGHNCFKEGDCKNTYGTGCFMLLNTGDKPILSKHGLLTTIAWNLDNKVTYALEGSVFIGGAAVQWLRDELKFIKDAKESEKLANKVDSSSGVYFVPAFVGLGTPYWDDDVRGSLFGLTRATNKYHIIRATLEGIAFECKDVFDVMSEDSGIAFNSLKVDGGATDNNLLMQFQSDICRLEIKKPECLETTALGVCYLAGLASKFWNDLDDISKTHSFKMTFNPLMDKKRAQRKVDGYRKAVACARMFKVEQK